MRLSGPAPATGHRPVPSQAGAPRAESDEPGKVRLRRTGPPAPPALLALRRRPAGPVSDAPSLRRPDSPERRPRRQREGTQGHECGSPSSSVVPAQRGFPS